LLNSKLNKTFWAEAVTYAIRLINRLPSSAMGGMWLGKAASDYDMLRVFGCPAYYDVSNEKLDPQARKVVFLGFKRGVKGYKL